MLLVHLLHLPSIHDQIYIATFTHVHRGSAAPLLISIIIIIIIITLAMYTD